MTRMRACLPLPLQCKAAGLPEPVAEFRFAALHGRRWRFDFAWILEGVAVEVDGGGWINGRHSRGSGIEKDCEKLNAAVAFGWRVLRVTPAMVADGRALKAIEAVLR